MQTKIFSNNRIVTYILFLVIFSLNSSYYGMESNLPTQIENLINDIRERCKALYNTGINTEEQLSHEIKQIARNDDEYKELLQVACNFTRDASLPSKRSGIELPIDKIKDLAEIIQKSYSNDGGNKEALERRLKWIDKLEGIAKSPKSYEIIFLDVFYDMFFSLKIRQNSIIGCGKSYTIKINSHILSTDDAMYLKQTKYNSHPSKEEDFRTFSLMLYHTHVELLKFYWDKMSVKEKTSKWINILYGSFPKLFEYLITGNKIGNPDSALLQSGFINELVHVDYVKNENKSTSSTTRLSPKLYSDKDELNDPQKLFDKLFHKLSDLTSFDNLKPGYYVKLYRMLTKAGISSDDYKRVKKIGKLDIVNSAKNSGITPEEIGFPVEEKQQITVIEKQKEEGLDTQFKVVEQSKSELEKTQTQLKIPVNKTGNIDDNTELDLINLAKQEHLEKQLEKQQLKQLSMQQQIFTQAYSDIWLDKLRNKEIDPEKAINALRSMLFEKQDKKQFKVLVSDKFLDRFAEKYDKKGQIEVLNMMAAGIMHYTGDSNSAYFNGLSYDLEKRHGGGYTIKASGTRADVPYFERVNYLYEKDVLSFNLLGHL